MSMNIFYFPSILPAIPSYTLQFVYSNSVWKVKLSELQLCVNCQINKTKEFKTRQKQKNYKNEDWNLLIVHIDINVQSLKRSWEPNTLDTTRTIHTTDRPIDTSSPFFPDFCQYAPSYWSIVITNPASHFRAVFWQWWHKYGFFM